MRLKKWVREFRDHYARKLKKPCTRSLEYMNKHRNLQEAWEKCDRPDWLHWLLCYGVSMTIDRNLKLVDELYSRAGEHFYSKNRTVRVTLCKTIRLLFPVPRVS